MRLILALTFSLIAGAAHAQCVNVSEASGTNAAPVINAAFTGGPLVKASPCVNIIGTVQTCGLITVPTNGMLQGYGRSSVLKRTCDGDMVRLMSSVRLRDIYLDGQSDAYAGSAIVVEEEGYQQLHSVGAYSRAPVLHFRKSCSATVNGGANSFIENFSFISWPNVNEFAVKLPDADAQICGYRYFRGGHFNGGWGIDLNGSTRTTVDGVVMTAIRYKQDSPTALTTAAIVVNSRIAQATTVEIKGNYNVWRDNLTGAPLVRCMSGTTNTDIWEYTTKTATDSPNCRLHDSLK